MIEMSERKIHQFPRFFMLLSVPLGLFVMLTLGFIGLIPLKVETHSIIIIFLILVIFMFFIIHNAWYSFSYFRNNMDSVIVKIEKYLISNELEIANRKKSFGNIDPFFEDHFKNVRNDNFASVASSIFPTLGILGTFTAIAISMPDFSVESQAALENEISILLSGIGTAFYASIFGIFLSLWWVFFEKRGLTKIQKDIDIIKEGYLDKMWKKEELEVLTLVQNRSQNDKLLEKIQTVITPDFIYKLDEIAQGKIELIEKLDSEHKNTEEELINRYKDLTSLFNNTSSKQNEVLQSFDKLHTSISKTNTLLANSILEQNSHSNAVKKEIYSVLSSFELVSSDLKKLGRTLVEKQIEESKVDEQ